MLLVAALAFAELPTEPELFAALLARMDTDGDARLTRAEYTPFDANGTFDDIDADRDGSITAAELGAWVKVTQPRPLDRPPRTVAAIAAGEGTPSFASLPGGPPLAAEASRTSASAPGTPGGVDRSTVRALVLGGMTLLAALAGWFVLRTPPRRRR